MDDWGKKLLKGLGIRLGLKRSLQIGLACSSVVLLLLALFVRSNFSNWIFFIPFALSVLVQVPLAIFVRSNGKLNQTITRAQIDSLLRVDNQLTAKRLASATGTSEKTAAEYLGNLFKQNELSVTSSETELVYRRP